MASILTHVCVHCGASYQTLIPRQKYCGYGCAREATKIPNPKGRRGVDRWKRAIRLRDRVCQDCGATTDLHAHHIKPWREFPALRYDLSNGVLLCAACHRIRDNMPGITARGWNGEIRRCKVCNIVLNSGSRKNNTGCCRKHCHSAPRPNRVKPWTDNYRKGKVCTVCGVSIHNLSKTGLCKVHYWELRRSA